MKEELVEKVAKELCKLHYGHLRGFKVYRQQWLGKARAILPIIGEELAKTAESEAGVYTTDGEGDAWIALRIAQAIREATHGP